MWAPSGAPPILDRLHGKAQVIAALKQIDKAIALVAAFPR